MDRTMIKLAENYSANAPCIRSELRKTASVDLHLDVVPLQAHGIDLDVDSDRRPHCLAGADLEAAGMERAFDDVAIEPAIGEHGEGVSADIVGSADLALDIVESDLLAAMLDPLHLAGSEVGELRYGDP